MIVLMQALVKTDAGLLSSPDVKLALLNKRVKSNQKVLYQQESLKGFNPLRLINKNIELIFLEAFL